MHATPALAAHTGLTTRLQISSLIPNVSPKDKHLSALESLLHAVHAHLMDMPSVPLQHPLSASRSLLEMGIATPYPSPPPGEDTNWKVAFGKPTGIHIVGSWANKIAVKKQDGEPFGIDLIVEMPSVSNYSFSACSPL